MDGDDRRYHRLRLVQRFLIEPPARLVWRLGLTPPGDAELETIGRRTGKPQVTRICDGLVGNTVWFIAQHGRRSDHVGNIEADPHVRFRAGARLPWRSGVAHVLDDEPGERRRLLAERDPWLRLCLGASHAMSTDPVTIRIDLEPSGSATAGDQGVPGVLRRRRR